MLQTTCHGVKTRCATELKDLVGIYEDRSDIKCRNGLQECDDMTFGGLWRALKGARLIDLSESMSSHSVGAILHKLTLLHVKSYCATSGRMNYHRSMGTNPCGCSNKLRAIQEQLEGGILGFAIVKIS